MNPCGSTLENQYLSEYQPTAQANKQINKHPTQTNKLNCDSQKNKTALITTTRSIVISLSLKAKKLAQLFFTLRNFQMTIMVQGKGICQNTTFGPPPAHTGLRSLTMYPFRVNIKCLGMAP